MILEEPQAMGGLIETIRDTSFTLIRALFGLTKSAYDVNYLLKLDGLPSRPLGQRGIDNSVNSPLCTLHRA